MPPKQSPPPPVNNLPEPQPLPITAAPRKSNKKLFIGLILLIILMIGLMAAIVLDITGKKTNKVKVVPAVGLTNQEKASSAKAKTEGLQVNATKNYGNKYANGILPVGDNKYVTAGPKGGYVYLCHANFVPAGQAGAQTRGPWFVGTTQYDINKKAHVDGQVVWVSKLDEKVVNGKRVITTNDEPSHVSGVFPVQTSDPAYAYDRNPNTITAQSLSYNLDASPSYGSPQCMGGEVGIMLTGVALFNGFDAGGRDAGAWEVQDSCDGHPQNQGEYHYHSLSSCIVDTSVNTVIGYALDGFPITGPKVSKNNILTTADLDECHGLVSQVNLDNKKITTYHYVMTQDFPYSASCFRATAIQPPHANQPNKQSPNHP